MKIVPLNYEHLDACCDLFVESFHNDHIYTSLFSDTNVRKTYLKNVVLSSLDYILNDNNSWCAIDNNTVIGFIWNVDYSKLTQKPEQLGMIFSGTPYATDNKYFNKIHSVACSNDNTLYIVSCAVSKDYQNQGISGALIDRTLSANSYDHFICDVSNKYLFSKFRRLEFHEMTLDTDYLLFYR